MASDILEKGWKDMRSSKVRSKNVLRQGDSNLSRRNSYRFSSSFNSTMTELQYIALFTFHLA